MKSAKFTSLLKARALGNDGCSFDNDGSWTAFGAVGKRFGVS